MPFRRLPNSDESRFTALQTCKLKKDKTDPSQWPFSDDNAAKLETIFLAFKTALGDRANAQSDDSAASNALGTAFNTARQLISHFIQALNNAIDRHVFPATVRAYYQLDIAQAAVPKLSSQADVLLWGNRLAVGEAKRIAAGGIAIPFPTIDEVNAAIADFQTKRTIESGKAGILTADAQIVANQRADVDALILDLWEEIVFAFRKDPPATARDKCRAWGVVYGTHPGEQPDPTPTPTPSTPIKVGAMQAARA